MKKYSIVLVILLFVPSVTLAAWWNPATWFQSADNNLPQQISPEIVPEAIPTSLPESQASTTVQVQTIKQTTNTESTLLSKIDVLTAQNTSLESKIANIEKQLATTQNSYSICQSNLTVAQNNRTATRSVDALPQQTTPITETPTIIFSGNDPSAPPTTVKSISVTTTGNGQYLGLPVITLYLVPSSNDIYLHTLIVNFTSSGQGTVNTAYLYAGIITSASRPIATGIIMNGVVTFTINPSDPIQIQLYKNSLNSPSNPNNLLTVKADVSGLAHSGDSEVISTSVSNMTANTSTNQNVNISGAANGNIITVRQP